MKKFNISKYSPCGEAIEYYKNYDSFEEAWNNCKRGDWMLWIASKLDVDEKLIFKANGAARKKNQLETAKICREILTDEVFKTIKI